MLAGFLRAGSESSTNEGRAMYVVGQKVRVVRGENTGARGIITVEHDQWGWYCIRTNKGRDLLVVPFNVIEAR